MVRKYALSFLFFNIGFVLLLFGIAHAAPQMQLNKISWSIYTLFVVSTLMVHLFLTGDNSIKDNVFIRKFMLATALKLLVYLAIIVFFFLFYKALAKTFILWFLLHYTCFTAFETIMLYSSNNK